jgi:hypothetical protein
MRSKLTDKKIIRIRLFRIIGLIFIFIMTLRNPFIACTDLNSAFYEKILNDFDTTSSFISLNIKAPSYKGLAIIENI